MFEVNFEKSSLTTWQNDHSWVETMANNLGCKLEKLPMRYLGLPLGVSCKSIKCWTPVNDKINQKLTIWRCKMLSKSGRVQLIKIILNSLPVYYLSVFKIPSAVENKIISLQRKFLWGGDESKRALPIVALHIQKLQNQMKDLE